MRSLILLLLLATAFCLAGYTVKGKNYYPGIKFWNKGGYGKWTKHWEFNKTSGWNNCWAEKNKKFYMKKECNGQNWNDVWAPYWNFKKAKGWEKNWKHENGRYYVKKSSCKKYFEPKFFKKYSGKAWCTKKTNKRYVRRTHVEKPKKRVVRRITVRKHVNKCKSNDCRMKRWVSWRVNRCNATCRKMKIDNNKCNEKRYTEKWNNKHIKRRQYRKVRKCQKPTCEKKVWIKRHMDKCNKKCADRNIDNKKCNENRYIKKYHMKYSENKKEY